MTMLYFAYGMNTNLIEMQIRCPDSKCLGRAQLLDHVFRFATHADVVHCINSEVDGVLWQISHQDLASLDCLEAYPVYYNRSQLAVAWQGQTVQAEVYHMQPGIDNQLPSSRYLSLIEDGYRANGVPLDQLHNAVAVFTTKFDTL